MPFRPSALSLSSHVVLHRSAPLLQLCSFNELLPFESATAIFCHLFRLDLNSRCRPLKSQILLAGPCKFTGLFSLEPFPPDRDYEERESARGRDPLRTFVGRLLLGDSLCIRQTRSRVALCAPTSSPRRCLVGRTLACIHLSVRAFGKWRSVLPSVFSGLPSDTVP